VKENYRHRDYILFVQFVEIEKMTKFIIKIFITPNFIF
jgi:hypothetical protein